MQGIANAMLEKIGVPKYDVEKTLASFKFEDDIEDDKGIRITLQSATGPV